MNHVPTRAGLCPSTEPGFDSECLRRSSGSFFSPKAGWGVVPVELRAWTLRGRGRRVCAACLLNADKYDGSITVLHADSPSGTPISSVTALYNCPKCCNVGLFRSQPGAASKNLPKGDVFPARAKISICRFTPEANARLVFWLAAEWPGRFASSSGGSGLGTCWTRWVGAGSCAVRGPSSEG